MKKRNINKIIAFTLCFMIVSTFIAKAETITESKVSSYSASSISLLPEDKDEGRH